MGGEYPAVVYGPGVLGADRLEAWVEESLADSPLYLRLGRVVVGDRHLLDLAGNASPGQPPLLPLFAAVHFLLLTGSDHPLAAYYPSVGGGSPPDDDVGAAFSDFCKRNRAELLELGRTRLVQTNEVARAAVLVLGLGVVAARIGGPVGVIELGASAGLLLRWDRYRYEYGSAGALGDAGSLVKISCVPRGPTPPLVPAVMPEAAWRVGIDLDPVDLSDPLAARWLEALVWPDQDQRRHRLLAAIDVALSHPVGVIEGDAVAELPGLMSQCPAETPLCVVHSMTLNQFSPESRDGLERVLSGAGRPVTRLSMEWIDAPGPVLTLVEYDRGRRSAIDLAEYHHHGDWIAWR
jgi:hypothetical protein